VSKQIIALMVLLLLLVSGVFFYLQYEQQNTSPVVASSKLLDAAGKPFDFSSLHSMQISKGDRVLLNAQVLDGNWYDFQFDAKTGFPIKSEALFALLRQIQSAKVLELKTADPANHAKLGLANSASTLTSLEQSSTAATAISLIGRQEIDILLGKSAKIQQGQFVRFTSEDQTFLVDQMFNLPTSSFSWLKTDLLSIDRTQILEVSAFEGQQLLWRIQQQNGDVTETDDKLAELSMPASSHFKLLSQSDNETLAYENVLLNYISSLEELSFTSLAYLPVSDAIMQSASMRLLLKIDGNSAQFNTVDAKQNDETVIQIALFKEDEKHFVHILATGEREYLNAWRYEIPSYLADSLLKTRNDFLRQNDAN